jgi:hypothetical protein
MCKTEGVRACLLLFQVWLERPTERERVICEKREEGGLEGAFLVPQKWSNMRVFEAPRRRNRERSKTL